MQPKVASCGDCDSPCGILNGHCKDSFPRQPSGRNNALDKAFLLHGSDAPRDPKDAAQFGVKVIVQDLGLLRGANGRPQIDIKPGMAIPALPTHATIGAKPAVPKNGERPTDKRRHD